MTLSLTYATSFGDLEKEDGTAWTTYMQSLVLNWQLNCRLNYILQSDFRTDKDEIDGNLLKYYGINQYLLYTISDRWAAGTRVEWFRAEQNDESYNAAAVTLGLNYKPSKRIVVRPEIRWDSCGGNPSTASLQFDNDSRSSQFSGGLDCIVKF